MSKMKRIKEIFAKIKEGHPLWKKNNDAYKKRLEKAFDPLFIELEKLGVARDFSEALLFFGKEFVDSFGGSRNLFGDKISPARDRIRLDQAGLPVAVEKIFDVKVTKMDDRAIREDKLAEKSGALVYRTEPMKGNRVGIKVLKYKKS